MELKIDVSQLQAVVDKLQGYPRRQVASASIALTRTAVLVADAERAEMRDVFDRPTRFTVRANGSQARDAVYVKAAQYGETSTRLVRNERLQPVVVDDGPNRGGPQAEVGIRAEGSNSGRGAAAWLRWHIYGGRRTLKGFEKLLMRAGAMQSDMRAVPGRFAKIDASGNMSRGQIVQILSQLRIDTAQGSTRSLPRIVEADDAYQRGRKAKVIKAAYKRAGGQFFALPFGRGKLRAGVYQSRSTGFGRTDPRPVLIFVTRAEYEAGRFDFHYVASLTIARHLPGELERSVQDALDFIAVNPGARR